MLTFLYALLVHLTAAGFMACCFFAGMSLMGPIVRRGWAEWILDMAARCAMGIVAGSTVVVLLGLMQILSAESAWASLSVLVAVGAYRYMAWRGKQSSDLVGLLRPWRKLSTAMGVVCLVIAVAVALLSLNIVVGALAPDVQRDSLWYHLTLPGQWLIRGDIAMFPYCMPSTYTLGVEALYVFLLPLGDTLFVTVFVSHVHLLTLAVFLAIAWRIGGRTATILAAALIPFAYASSFAYVPIPAKPDPVTVFLLGIGWWRLARLLDGDARPQRGELLIAGALCGGAVVAKLSSLLLLLPLGVCFVVMLFAKWRDGRMLLAALIWPSVGALVILMPWLVRAMMYSGNPVIHIARGLLPITEEFVPALRGYDRVPMFHPLTLEGLRAAFVEALPARLERAAMTLNVLFFLIPVASIIAVGVRIPSVRATSIGFLVAYLLWVPLLYGRGEEIRYFGVGALAAAPALAGMCHIVSCRLRPGMLPIVAAALLVATGITYVRQQHRHASLPTVNWGYRPVVTTEDRLEWLEPTADGLRSHYYQLLDGALPPDAHVLMLDSRGPFFLNRRAQWCDYFTCPMVDDWWPGYDAFEAHADLQARGITHIVSENEIIDPRIVAMAPEGLIIPMPIDNLPPDWSVWIVGVQ